MFSAPVEARQPRHFKHGRRLRAIAAKRQHHYSIAAVRQKEGAKHTPLKLPWEMLMLKDRCRSKPIWAGNCSKGKPRSEDRKAASIEAGDGTQSGE
jgi:hypothetical protein